MTEQPPSTRRRGRPTVPIVVSEDERQTLERWARRRTSSQALALPCRIVLACAEGGEGEGCGPPPPLGGGWKPGPPPRFDQQGRRLRRAVVNPAAGGGGAV